MSDEGSAMTSEDLGTTRWFGPSWGAPVNDPRTEMSVPLGEACLACKVDFEHGDQGVGIAAHTSIAANGQVFYHRDCFLDEVLGSGWRSIVDLS